MSKSLLDNIKSSASDSKIVALGEASHYTNEFNQARTEIINELVTTDNFRLILIETQNSALSNINNYLAKKSCHFPSAEDLGPLFDGWKDKNTAKLLQSLCKKDTNVKFFGFDAQSMQNILPIRKHLSSFSPESDIIKNFNEYSKKCPYLGGPLNQPYDNDKINQSYKDNTQNFLSEFPNTKQTKNQEFNAQICMDLFNSINKTVKDSTDIELKISVNSLTADNYSFFVLNELLDTTPTVRNMAYNQMRDKAMAENIKIILNTKKSKATL